MKNLGLRVGRRPSMLRGSLSALPGRSGGDPSSDVASLVYLGPEVLGDILVGHAQEGPVVGLLEVDLQSGVVPLREVGGVPGLDDTLVGDQLHELAVDVLAPGPHLTAHHPVDLGGVAGEVGVLGLVDVRLVDLVGDPGQLDLLDDGDRLQTYSSSAL
jgi:hypothetical protein